MTPALASLPTLGSVDEEQAIAYAAHLATQPGVLSAVYNPETSSIDLVVEPAPYAVAPPVDP